VVRFYTKKDFLDKKWFYYVVSISLIISVANLVILCQYKRNFYIDFFIILVAFTLSLDFYEILYVAFFYCTFDSFIQELEFEFVRCMFVEK